MQGRFIYIYQKFEPNVGKYTSPMHPIGYVSLQKKTTKRSIPTLFGQLPNLACRSHAKNPTLVKYQVSDRKKKKNLPEDGDRTRNI